MSQTLQIVIALFPGVTHLDFTGPHQVLCRLPGAKVTVASLAGGEIEADGLVFARLPKLSDIETCDVLIVPGGFGTTQAMGDPDFIAEIRRLADGARYVCSVCTGSLVLAAAGLLKGKRAACHWAWRDQLALFGAVPDAARVARDGRYITGGGVTAGIDFALTLIPTPAPPGSASRTTRGPRSPMSTRTARPPTRCRPSGRSRPARSIAGRGWAAGPRRRTATRWPASTLRPSRRRRRPRGGRRWAARGLCPASCG